MLLRLLFYFISISMMLLNIVAADEPGLKCKKTSVQQQCAMSGAANTDAAALQETNSWWFADTYDAAQEQVFMRLQAEFEQDPWSICTLQVGAGPADYSYDKRLRETMPMNVFANSSEMFDAELISFSGDIDLQRADQHVMANHIDYNEAAGILDLYGNILYSDSGMALHSQSARVNLYEDRSLLRDVSFVIPTSPMRGSASVVYRDSPSFSRYKDVTYTACAPGNQDWMLHASRMKVNNETGRVAIKHGWMEFKSVPVMYFPYGSFPVDDRRLSGLLTPTLGVSGRSGFDISLPFYWNIAPNYDLTLTPRYMTERGFMLGTDFRYLWHESSGEINVEVLPEDQLTNELRWGGSFLHTTHFTKNLKLAIDANYVSDKAYFSDLDGTLGVNNRNRYLESDAEISYTLPWMALTTRIENFQNIDPNEANSNVPYRRLPQVKLDMFKAFDSFPLELALDSEYVYFQKHDLDGEREGQRFNIKPSVSFPFVSQSGFIIPKVALQHTQYWLNNTTNSTASSANSLSKTLPIVSLDTGLFFERDFESLTHTIEPRLYYLYVPYTDQSDIPDFDTSRYDFNSNQLFRDNEFNGVDKTQNANQITAALTTRLVGDGRDRLKLTVGEIVYFADRKVNLASDVDNRVNKEALSDLIAELSSEITNELKFTSYMQWSHKNNKIDRGNVDLRYLGLSNRFIFNLGYRYRDEREGQVGQDQIVASAMLPIYDGWSIVGLYRYSFLDSKTLEYLYGVEKDSCCWRFRVIGRQFIRSDAGEVKPENSVFFQLELKGLTSLGDKLEGFLSENISGYRKPTY
ncbi:MAG: LPS assembly protein LptD [Methyloprofundus sp.]|nr:LPS assembly protein LptD [Methyloprofundus sp.]